MNVLPLFKVSPNVKLQLLSQIISQGRLNNVLAASEGVIVLTNEQEQELRQAQELILKTMQTNIEWMDQYLMKSKS